MKIKSTELSGVYGITSRLPEAELPELVFAGRSNVGKSSLINSLMNRKNLARTSSSPGKTVTINFYKVNGEFFLVDLPGYGYAKTSQETRAKWGHMIERFLRDRESIRAVVLLIDIRHAPTKDDVQMFEWIRASKLTPVIAATKLDKIKRSQREKQLKLIRDTLGIKMSDNIKIIPYSSETKEGRDELLGVIYELIQEEVQD